MKMESIDHATLPSIAKAPLPATYSRAKAALKECSRVDECRTWANKAQAMASYAKQADDDSLFKMAVKIQARAIKRCGELLREFKPGKGGRPKKNGKPGGELPLVSRAQAARDAGMSRDQKRTALRVASIPDDEFEEAVESDNPPTVTELAKRGTKSKPTHGLNLEQMRELYSRLDPNDIKLAIRAYGALERLAKFAAAADPAACARGEFEVRRKEMRDNAVVVREWTERLIEECGK